MRSTLIVLTIFIAAWFGAIVYWRSIGADPSGWQLFLLLAFCPLLVIAIWWSFIRGAKKQASEPSEEEVLANTAEDIDVLKEDSTAYQLEISAAAVHLPIGNDSQLILKNANDMPRPGLHPTLRDRDGLPVFAAFLPDLDVKVQDLAFDRYGGSHIPDEQLRAIALLEPVADQLLEDVYNKMPPPPEPEEKVTAGLRRLIMPSITDVLHVSVLVSTGWSSDLRNGLVNWLRDKASNLGFDERQLQIDTIATQGPTDVWNIMDQFGQAEDHGINIWRLLLACDSLVAQSPVARLAAIGQLMTGQRSSGILPGEGAAGVLVKRFQSVVDKEGQPSVLMHRILTKGVDVGMTARAASRVLGDLIVQSLTASAVRSDEIVYVVSETGQQRAGQITEIGAGIIMACPDLDISSQCCVMGPITGYIGPVAPLAVLGLAYVKVAESRHPVLALGIMDNQERKAVTLSYFNPPVADSLAGDDA